MTSFTRCVRTATWLALLACAVGCASLYGKGSDPDANRFSAPPPLGERAGKSTC